MPKEKKKPILAQLPPAILQFGHYLSIGTRETRAVIELYKSDQLSHFPKKIRALRARQLVTDFYLGYKVGSHIDGFYPDLLPSEHWREFPDLQIRTEGIPEAAQYPVIERRPPTSEATNLRAALHIHAYYLDGFDALLHAIKMNSNLPDLFITTPAHHVATVEEMLKDYPRTVDIIVPENIGRDIVPFLKLLPKILEQRYDVIGHVHIKRTLSNPARTLVSQWVKYNICALIGSPERGVAAIDDVLRDLESHPHVQIYIPHPMDSMGWHANRTLAQEIIEELNQRGITDIAALPDHFIFGVGTMFWATANYLSTFAKIDLPWEKVAAEPLPDDGTVLHAIERLFGAIATVTGNGIRICPAVEKQFAFSRRLMRRLERYL